MSVYRLEEVQPSTVLRDLYGEYVHLESDTTSDQTEYRILKEFSVRSNLYAVLQSDALKDQGEVLLFRIEKASNGEPELTTIEDDDEWEDILELYDEMTFEPSSHEQ